MLTVALSASELKIVIGEGTYNGSSTEGMTFVVGDVLTVKGYLQKGEDTLTVTGKDGTTPTIEGWESANKDTPALDAEADKAALEKFFAALIEEVKGMEDLTKEFVLPLPTRPGVTFAFNVKAGDAAVTITDGKVIKVTRGADAVEVTIEATIKVAGAKSDFTVDGSPFTFTVPQTKPATVEGSFTVGLDCVEGLTNSYRKYNWSASDGEESTLTGTLFAYANLDKTQKPTEMQFNKSQGTYYIVNTIPTPAPISAITFEFKQGSISDWALYVSTKPYIADGQNPTISESEQPVTVKDGKWEITGENYYFALIVTGSGAKQITSFEIGYKGQPLNDEKMVELASQELAIDQTEFTSEFVLPTTLLNAIGVKVEWSIQNGGEAVQLDETKTKLLINRQAEEVTFSLIAKIQKGEAMKEKTFSDLKVLAALKPGEHDEPAEFTTLTFEAGGEDGGHTTYCDGSPWSAVRGDYTWSLLNFANNNNQWGYVRCGSKTKAATASITSQIIGYVVTSVNITIDKCTISKVTAAELQVCSDENFSKDVTTYSFKANMQASTQTEIEVSIPEEAQGANLYYRIWFDCAKGSSNGLVQLSKIALVGYKEA